MSIGIIEHFSELKDPRIERKKLHSLMDIIVIVICGVISGAEGWEAIADFAKEKEEWFRKYIPLENGIPSHDCIAYTIHRLAFHGFRECFMAWAQGVTEELGGQVISIDGKTSRGSRDKRNDRNPLHMVSAWAAKSRLVLGQEAVDEKSNEITAIPKLLNLLEIKGCIITIDAMGCQKKITEKIKAKGGDYVIGLKGNQSLLHDAVQSLLNNAEKNSFAGIPHDFKEEKDKGHGRVERRRYWVTDQIEGLPNIEKWKGLKSVGMVERKTLENGKETIDRRYFINSISPDANEFAKAVREHWGIENRLHWRLDVIFREDSNRIRKGNAPAIMTTVRHLCMGILDSDKSTASLIKKRRMATWSDDYRANIVFGNGF